MTPKRLLVLALILFGGYFAYSNNDAFSALFAAVMYTSLALEVRVKK